MLRNSVLFIKIWSQGGFSNAYAVRWVVWMTLLQLEHAMKHGH